MEKRTRCAPFTQEEKYILEEVVGRFSDTIENKRTDATSSRQKREAWVKVTVTFNSYGNVTRRSAEQLRKAWENLKTNRRKKASKPTDHREVTSNGVSHQDQTEEPLLELQSPHFIMHTVEQVYDSDAAYVRSSTSAECSDRPASPLASFAYITDTPVLEEDMDDAEDEDHSLPHLSQEGDESFPTIQVEDQPILTTSFAQNKSYGNLGGSEVSFPHSSSARDISISRTSSRVACLPNHIRETPSSSSGSGKQKSIRNTSATVMSSSGTVEEIPTRSTNRSENASISSAVKGRVAVLREEHETRMSQLTVASQQRDELHMIRVREARAVAEAAESQARAESSRARAELARAMDAEEELEYNRKRRRELMSRRDRSPLS